MFTISSIRQQLRRPQTSFRWTATANSTKWMDAAHLRSTLSRGEWSIENRPEFVKQTSKKKPAAESLVDDADLPGRPLNAQDQLLMEHVQRRSESAGWHFVEGVGIHVAHQAGSFRSPVPRFAVRDFPYRTTIGEFKRAQNLSTWRILEQRVDLLELANPQKQLFREELCA